MGNAIVTNRKIYIPNAQLVTSDVTGREQVQRLDNDWADIPIGYFSYTSASRITIAGFTPITYFQVGDLLWIKQNDSEKYFYVIDVGDDYLDVNAGTDYTFTSDTLQFIRFSRMPNPSGFAGSFNYLPTVTLDGDTFTITPASTIVKYKMLGNYVIINGVIWGTVTSGVATNGSITYPFPIRDEVSTKQGATNNPYDTATFPGVLTLAYGWNVSTGLSAFYFAEAFLQVFSSGGLGLHSNIQYYQ